MSTQHATATASAVTARFEGRAMGSSLEVVVVAEQCICDDLLALARLRVTLLEERWSRFLVASELNRLNERAGTGPVEVSADLLVLVSAMLEGWEATGGLFDPTVLESVRAHGYDADFAAVCARDFVESAVAASPALGMGQVIVDPAAGTVELPAGIGLDPGAIGKGLAADLIVDDLLAAGADGALVSLGGDLSFAGAAPDGTGWVVGVEDERVPVGSPDRLLATWAFTAERGGVATSTTRKRRWAKGSRHHSIDPRTGGLSASDVQQASVIAERAWIAETAATAALVLDSQASASLLADRGLPALLLTHDQTIDLTAPTRSSHE